VIEAIADDRQRILLKLATGTGKTVYLEAVSQPLELEPRTLAATAYSLTIGLLEPSRRTRSECDREIPLGSKLQASYCAQVFG